MLNKNTRKVKNYNNERFSKIKKKRTNPIKNTRKSLQNVLSINNTKSLKKGSIFNYKSVQKTSYKGRGEDLLFSFLYLSEKYSNFYIPMGDFSDGYIMWNILTSWKCESIYDKKFILKLPKSEEKFIKDLKRINKDDNIRYILLPIYLGTSDCKIENGHFNIAIVDLKRRTFERFEPYGYYMNLTIHRPLNKKIVKIFKKAGIRLQLKELNDRLPKIGFQEIEEREIERSIASLRNNDPGGFCGSWAVWYVELVLKNPHLSRKKLIKLAIKLIREGESFRKFIRNYSVHLVKNRKKMLKNISELCAQSISEDDFFYCTKKYIKTNLVDRSL